MQESPFRPELQLDKRGYLLFSHKKLLKYVVQTRNISAGSHRLRNAETKPSRKTFEDGKKEASAYQTNALLLLFYTKNLNLFYLGKGNFNRSRPAKNATITLSPGFFIFTSSIEPVNVSNGPSIIRTASPTEKV